VVHVAAHHRAAAHPPRHRPAEHARADRGHHRAQALAHERADAPVAGHERGARAVVGDSGGAGRAERERHEQERRSRRLVDRQPARAHGGEEARPDVLAARLAVEDGAERAGEAPARAGVIPERRDRAPLGERDIGGTEVDLRREAADGDARAPARLDRRAVAALGQARRTDGRGEPSGSGGVGDYQRDSEHGRYGGEHAHRGGT
jgi:hypothetical protein